MFIIIAGRRGTGKTAMGVHTLASAIQKKVNNTVWCNFFWAPSLLKNKQGQSWFADKLADIADMRKGTFVLDEAYTEAGNADWKLTPLESSCLRQSRHLEMDIFLITINFRDLNTSCRRTADEVWIFHKIGKISWYFAYLPEDLDDDGVRKKGKKCIGFGWFWHSKKLHQLYDDKEILLDALRNRPPREWRDNELFIP